ncbi:hypothetical protein ACIQVA_24220 [Streptomyces microflavus]|uniref:hypothetical protein n=1 Tax=Streptomyces microflavus TaxID=1919 RepID=UPI003818B2E2
MQQPGGITAMLGELAPVGGHFPAAVGSRDLRVCGCPVTPQAARELSGRGMVSVARQLGLSVTVVAVTFALGWCAGHVLRTLSRRRPGTRVWTLLRRCRWPLPWVICLAPLAPLAGRYAAQADGSRHAVLIGVGVHVNFSPQLYR